MSSAPPRPSRAAPQCLYQRAGKLSDAFADLNKALNLKKDYPEAAFRRAQILRKKEQYDLAIFDLVRVS